jgi:hypothetical protein
MNYTKANELHGKRARRKLCNNTYLERRGADIAVRLHATDVLVFRPDNSVVYNSGGWRTVTTKERMNSYGADGRWIWQDKGIWSIGTRGRRKLYEDGVIITANGKIIGGGDSRKAKAELRRRKEVQSYCKRFALALVEGKVKPPGAGDCFYCQMVEVDSKKPLGDATNNHDHLQSHIKESYFVPSLLVNAGQDEWAPISPIVRSCIGEVWSGKPIHDNLKGIVIRQVTKTLEKYIKHRLGLVA